MARAKRTERAEARRRYRAYLATQAESEGDEAAVEASPAAPAPRQILRGKSRSRDARSNDPLRADQPPTGGASFIGAFRLAYRPLDLRGDLRLLVPLVTRSHAIWPIAVVAVAGVAFTAISPSSEVVSGFAAVLNPLNILPAIIAGFLAPRASWLAGIISTFIAGLAFAAMYVIVGGSSVGPMLLQTAGASLIYGGFFGAAAGYYRRYLNLISAHSRQAAQASRKPAARRR